MNGRIPNQSEMGRIEYQQIREDIRHTNKMIYYSFSIMIVIFALLMNVSYQIAINQNLNQPQYLLILIGIIGIVVILYIKTIVRKLYRVRKRAFNWALSLHPNSFVREIRRIEGDIICCCICFLMTLPWIWVIYLLILWISI